MIRDSRQRVFWTYLFPFVVMGLACLIGCQSQGPSSSVGVDTADTPEASLLRLLADPARENLQLAPRAETVVRSLGQIRFVDLSGGISTFQILQVEYLSPDLARVYTTYEFTDPDLLGTRADITFELARIEGFWRLLDFTFTKLPPVIVIGGLGVQGRVLQGTTPVAEAVVTLFQGETYITHTLTDSNGFYFLTAPSVGTYTVTATKDGYELMTHPDIYIY